MIPHVNDSKQDVDDEEPYNYEQAKEIKWYHHLLLNRPLKVILALLFTAVLAPLLVYHFLFFSSLDLPPSDGFSFGSCLLPRTSRLPCGLGTTTASGCHPQCCFDLSNNMCFHRFPSRFSYLLNQNWTEQVILLPRVPTVPFNLQSSITNMRISIDDVSPTHLSLNFYDSRQLSFEGRKLENKSYVYHISSPELNVMVNSTQGNIFNTVRGPLIASNNIWEMAFKLTEESMYGLGEIPLKQGTAKVIHSHDGGLSSVPLIFAKANNTYHGLLIDTKEPTEVRIEGDNHIVIRSITSLGLKFHIFVGPQPKDIMDDVTKLIGLNNRVDYWMLGAHVCSELSETPTNAYNELTKFLEEASREKLPFDSHCGTMPIVFDNDRCNYDDDDDDDDDDDYIDKGAKLIKDLKKKFVPHVSPFIRYEEEEASIEDNSTETLSQNSCTNIIPQFEKVFLRDSNSTGMYKGAVAGGVVIYPDYVTATDKFMDNLWKYKMKLNGVVLENSWPLDESLKSHQETYSALPYFNQNFQTAFNHTPKWNIIRPNGEKYLYSHNKYGNDFANAFKKVSNDKIPTWSTSQWMNGEVVINRQNINASWTNLQQELTEAALGGISGHRLWSSPVCGDTAHFDINTQTSLCVKWYMAATYLPMIKIHSKSVPRHPLAFIGTNKMHITTALKRRLSLLPYFYTTLQNGPLLRPMFYQFPSTEQLKDLRSQFSVGDDLLIVPNLQPSQSHVHLRMPPGSWYEIWSGLKIEGEVGEAVTMTTTEADFLTLIRGGSILVMQKDVEETAEETRQKSALSLKIALHCETADVIDQTDKVTACNAEGNLYVTESVYIDFKADTEKLTVKATTEAPCKAIRIPKINSFDVYGLNEEFNNNDNHRHVKASIDLCDLETKTEMEFSFL